MPRKSVKNTRGSAEKRDSEYSEAEFVLKHRVVGAAFLLFFGALFLPWVLGAPGQNQANLDEINSAETSMTNLTAEEMDSRSSGLEISAINELAAAIAGEESDVEEQVYISKITPLDSGEGNLSETPLQATNELNNRVPSASKSASQATSTKTSSELEQANNLNSVKEPTNSQSIATSNSSDSEPAIRQGLGSGRAAIDKPQDVEVGWAVQIGVFTDKQGAAKVVDDLENKGFSPSTTIVDTNRGRATGTRIWLGPFAQRVDAAKAKAELTKKTGEAGFIRAYP